MKKIFLFFLAVILLVSFNMNVNAIESSCTQEEQIRLRQLVNAAQISYDFYERDDEDGLFQGYNVSINNFKPDFYVENEEQAISFIYSGNEIVTADYFLGNITYRFPFYAADNTPCAGHLIMIKYLKLIPYNIYSKDPLCVGHETYELCKKFTPIQITSQDEFEQRMKQYIKNLENKQNNLTVDKTAVVKKSTLQKMGDFLTNNYMIFLIVIIISGTAGIVKIEIDKRRSIL